MYGPLFISMSCQCHATAMQVATATLGWLVGCHDFDVDADTADSSSISSSSNSSDGSPNATKAGNFKPGVPSSADGKMLSSTTINILADATAGPQGPANSSKKKIGRKNKKKGPESASTRAGDEAAKTAEKDGEKEEEEEDYVKVAAKSRGSWGKKRTAADSSAPLSINRTVQNGPELITGMAHT